MDSPPPIQGAVPHDLGQAIAAYGTFLFEVFDLTNPNVFFSDHDHDVVIRPFAQALSRLVDFHIQPSQSGDDALSRLSTIFLDSSNFDQRFLTLTPTAIAVAIFRDLDTAFFEPRLGSMVGLSVNAGLEPYELARTYRDDNSPQSRIMIFVAEITPLYIGRHGYHYSIQEMVKTLLHEMVHAFLGLYIWHDELSAMPDHPFPDQVGRAHGLAFSQVLGTIQMALDMAGWRLDLSDGGRYPRAMPVLGSNVGEIQWRLEEAWAFSHLRPAGARDVSQQ